MFLGKMNKDRDILILDARSANNGKERSKDAVGKDRPRDNRDSRSRDRGADRNSRGGGSGGGIDRLHFCCAIIAVFLEETFYCCTLYKCG